MKYSVFVLTLLEVRFSEDDVWNPSHEFAKYCVVFFLFLGVIYSGFSKSAIPYWIFLIILIPGVIIANENIDYSVDFRKKLLLIYRDQYVWVLPPFIRLEKGYYWRDWKYFTFLGLPIISTAAFVNLFAPNIKDVLTGTSSNEMLSGGFGPNQVATIFGLGMFIFFTRAILYSRTKIIFFTNLLLAFYISYRGFLTFSRGGMMTGFGMIGIFIFFMYYNSMYKGKVKLNYLIIILTIVMSITWIYTSIQTDGLINKRYAGKMLKVLKKKINFLEEANWLKTK